MVVHEASGLNDNIRDICRRFAAEGYAALGVDLFESRNRAVCMARMFVGGMAGNLDYYGVPALKAALGQLASHPEADAARIGAIGFCLGGSIVLTWACTDNRLAAIAPFYGAAPKPRKAIRRMCPVVGSWPGKDFTTKAAGVLETELTAASSPSRAPSGSIFGCRRCGPLGASGFAGISVFTCPSSARRRSARVGSLVRSSAPPSSALTPRDDWCR